MSYCRWSSDDYQCDAYVWADCAGGWRTEIAHRRRVWKVELPPPVKLPIGAAGTLERGEWAGALFERHRVVMDLLNDEANWGDLEHDEPEGGWSYWHKTPGECADNLERLVGLGFNVPASAIEALRSEEAT